MTPGAGGCGGGDTVAGRDKRKVVMPEARACAAWACHAGDTSIAASVALRMFTHSIRTLGTVVRLRPARSSLGAKPPVPS